MTVVNDRTGRQISWLLFVQNLELLHGIGFFIGFLVGKSYAAGAGEAPKSMERRGGKAKCLRRQHR
ncbi:hypothetical protein AAE045_07770 [Dryocola clanedunensis]